VGSGKKYFSKVQKVKKVLQGHCDIFQFKGLKQWGDDCGECVQPFCLPRHFSSGTSLH
jgi:hypothetical protein